MQFLKMAADFIAEAEVDQVRMATQLMAHSVTARRALWLKHWAADNKSKQNLYPMPFEGKPLFGKTLENAIH